MSNMTREEVLERVASATAVLDSNKKELDFDIDMNGYKGHFKVKHPSLLDQMNIGVVTSKLLKGIPGNQVNVIANNIAFMYATIMTVGKEVPTWFSIEKMDDYTVLEAIYEKYREWNETFRKSSEQVSNGGDSTSSENEGSMVGHEEVQSSNK